MGDMAEDRVYDERRAETVAYVASGQGVATVRVSSDRVGRFSLAEQCRARDVATVADTAAETRVYVATGDDVLAGPDPFEPLGFGPSVAVGADETGDGSSPVAAGENGRVARYRDGEWMTLGTVDDPRAIDGGLVASAGGVFRVDGDALAPVGLADVWDVAADGAPLAAAAAGLYRLGNGWLREREGTFTTVAAGDGHAHAATGPALFERAADEWTAVDLPTDEAVADVAYGECPYVVTERGTFLIDADPERTPDGTGGWRSRALGLTDVAALAVL